jgi:hypothetical protein
MADLSRRSRAADRSRVGWRRPTPTVPRKSQPPVRYRSSSVGPRSAASPGRRPRRATILFGLLSLVVGLVLLALGPLSQLAGDLGLAARSPSPSPAATTPGPPAPPRLITPAIAATAEPSWDLTVALPPDIVGRKGYRIRVYVDGERARQARVPRASGTFVVSDVPLERGWNVLTASLVGPLGEGPRSPAARVLYDAEPAPLTIESPRDGQVINAEVVVVRGTTQADSTITVRNERTGKVARAGTEDGDFKIEVRMGPRVNWLSVEVIDPGGHKTTQRLRVKKGDGTLSARLTISAALISADALPRSVTLRVAVRDPDGRPINDAKVVFSISPPGLPTSTYEAVTTKGNAAWPVVITDQATAGDGLATVFVELKTGETLRDTVRFRLFSESDQ